MTLYKKPPHGLPSGATNWLTEATVPDQVAALREAGVGKPELRCIPHGDIRINTPDSLKCWRGWVQNYGPECRIVPTLVVRIEGETT